VNSEQREPIQKREGQCQNQRAQEIEREVEIERKEGPGGTVDDDDDDDEARMY
jgi:hypothetical protein